MAGKGSSRSTSNTTTMLLLLYCTAVCVCVCVCVVFGVRVVRVCYMYFLTPSTAHTLTHIHTHTHTHLHTHTLTHTYIYTTVYTHRRVAHVVCCSVCVCSSGVIIPYSLRYSHIDLIKKHPIILLFIEYH
jgi:hypothetical protein